MQLASMRHLARLTVAALLAAPALATATLINITFDADTVGAAPATSAPGDPMTKPWAIGGYTPTEYQSPPTTAGTVLVDNPAGMSKAAVMTSASDNPALGAIWMDVNGFNLPGQAMHMGFDINVLSAPTDATTQPKILGAGTAGILLGMNAYTTNGWAFRFAAAPTSDNGGVFAFRSPDNTKLIPFFDYVEGTAYSIDIVADYSSGTLDAYVDGALMLSDYAFWTSGASNVTTNEFFFHLNGQEGGVSNSVAIDNIQAAAVPAPSTLLLLGAAWLAAGRVRRRRTQPLTQA